MCCLGYVCWVANLCRVLCGTPHEALFNLLAAFRLIRQYHLVLRVGDGPCQADYAAGEVSPMRAIGSSLLLTKAPWYTGFCRERTFLAEDVFFSQIGQGEYILREDLSPHKTNTFRPKIYTGIHRDELLPVNIRLFFFVVVSPLVNERVFDEKDI